MPKCVAVIHGHSIITRRVKVVPLQNHGRQCPVSKETSTLTKKEWHAPKNQTPLCPFISYILEGTLSGDQRDSYKVVKFSEVVN